RTAIREHDLLSSFKNLQTSPYSRERVIESLHDLHAAVEKLLVRDPLPGPALQYLIDPIPFSAAKLLVGQIRVMDDLGHGPHPPVADPEVSLQGLERAIVTSVSETVMEHVKWHRFARDMLFRSKREPRL